jgi:hypothetical protein
MLIAPIGQIFAQMPQFVQFLSACTLTSATSIALIWHTLAHAPHLMQTPASTFIIQTP